MITINVLENKTIELFLSNKEEPFMTFPTWPSGDEWLDVNEAQTWADRAFNQGLKVPNGPYIIDSQERLPLIS